MEVALSYKKFRNCFKKCHIHIINHPEPAHWHHLQSNPNWTTRQGESGKVAYIRWGYRSLWWRVVECCFVVCWLWHWVGKGDWISFLECNAGTSGCCLVETITTTLQSFGLDLIQLWGQAYNGRQHGWFHQRNNNHTTAQYPLVLYLYCASHCSNLAVIKSLLTSVHNIMGIMGVADRIYVFFDWCLLKTEEV